MAMDKEASELLDPNGLQIVDADFVEHFDLSDVRVTYALNFVKCSFSEKLGLSTAHVARLFFDSCWLAQGIEANELKCDGDVIIGSCTLDGVVNFYSANIGTDLFFNSCVVHAFPQKLVLDLVQVGGNIHFENTMCDRHFSAIGAKTGSALSFAGSKFTEKETSITLDSATIGGELFLNENVSPSKQRIAFECHGDFHAPHISIGQDIHGNAARFLKPAGSILFAFAMVRNGYVEFSGGKFSGLLDFEESQIAGQFLLDGTNFSKSGKAVFISGANIGLHVDLSDCTSDGTVTIKRSSIGGNLDLSRAKIDAQETALQVTDSEIKGQITADALQTTGEIDILNSKTGGNLSFAGATVRTDSHRVAISLSKVDIGRALLLSRNFETPGSVVYSGGSVGLNVSVVNGAMKSLVISNVHVAGGFFWWGVVNGPKTHLDLSGTFADSVVDDAQSWPEQGKMKLRDFKYRSLTLVNTPTKNQIENVEVPEAASQSVEDRIRWLKLQDSGSVLNSQPWLQLAAYYDGLGDGASAKRVMYVMGRVQNYSRGPLERLAYLPYDSLREDPMRVLIPVAPLWAVSTLIYWRARRMKAMAPTESSAYQRFMRDEAIDDYEPFNPAIYSLENILPVVNLGQNDSWRPDPSAKGSPNKGLIQKLRPSFEYSWLAAFRWTLILIGWLCALILVGAIGSRFKD
jgi:hypothetical protein